VARRMSEAFAVGVIPLIRRNIPRAMFSL
jgi:hypothetical protein